MNVLICICSKYPNEILINCIEHLYRFQVGDGNTYKICVVDSDSSDFIYYDIVKERFPEVEVHLVKNKHHEPGAWKYISDKHSNYDLYFCIQDSNIIHSHINLSVVDDRTAYTFHNMSGYYWHKSIQEKGIENLEKGTLVNYKDIIDTPFNLAQHSAFIVNRKTLEDIFICLPEPPVDKDGACFYERNYGLYFIIKGFTTLNLYEHMNKIHCNRI
jgi:hypothetical protein